MEVKLLEVRDRATFIPVMAISVEDSNDAQRYLLRRAGYGLDNPPQIILTQIAGGDGRATCDPYDWGGGARTMQHAHQWIIDNWVKLGDGDVVCVEHINGERDEPKVSERIAYP